MTGTERENCEEERRSQRQKLLCLERSTHHSLYKVTWSLMFTERFVMLLYHLQSQVRFICGRQLAFCPCVVLRPPDGPFQLPKGATALRVYTVQCLCKLQ